MYNIMKIAIVGFPGCGKSTVFKAVTQKREEETAKLDPTKPHLGTIKILDPRLEKLKSIFSPKRLTPAEFMFEDLPGFRIPDIKEVEALMAVLGVFSGSDPARDIGNLDTEFMLADLEIITKRLPGLEKEIKQSHSKEKDLEKTTLLKCKDILEKGAPLRNMEFTKDEDKIVRGFQFVSKKPVFFLGNIDEKQKDSAEVRKAKETCKGKNFKFMEFCARLESEIVDLEDSEREDFLKEMGITESASSRVSEFAVRTLGYITFFTVKGTETRAWLLREGSTAIEAAGKIHSEIQKGFIKAEVINFKDLVSSGSVAAAKSGALLKLEGKGYIIQDGDIVDFKFSV